MQQLTIYKILTYILLPFAALFGFVAVIFFFVGLANPLILLPVFLFAGFSIYTICCTIFLTKGIINNRYCKPSLKDWIKVNGYVASFLGAMSLTNCLSILTTPKAKFKDLAAELLANQPIKPAGFSIDTIVSMMIGMSYVLLAFAIILLVHVSINFRLLKKYGYVFGEAPAE